MKPHETRVLSDISVKKEQKVTFPKKPAGTAEKPGGKAEESSGKEQKVLNIPARILYETGRKRTESEINDGNVQKIKNGEEYPRMSRTVENRQGIEQNFRKNEQKRAEK